MSSKRTSPSYNPATTIGPTSGYRATDTGREPGKEPALRHTYFVLAFSGGGTRAAAFAQGALRELGATPSLNAPELTLLDAVDMISFTSGGSVTAANFVLRGPSGYRFLDEDGGLLKQNGMTDLILGMLDPLDIAERTFSEKSRIQLLSGWFQRSLFRDWTFNTIAQQKFRRPPLLVLNSADMATESRFPSPKATRPPLHRPAPSQARRRRFRLGRLSGRAHPSSFAEILPLRGADERAW